VQLSECAVAIEAEMAETKRPNMPEVELVGSPPNIHMLARASRIVLWEPSTRIGLFPLVLWRYSCGALKSLRK